MAVLTFVPVLQCFRMDGATIRKADFLDRLVKTRGAPVVKATVG